jgi:hypothetical protein
MKKIVDLHCSVSCRSPVAAFRQAHMDVADQLFPAAAEVGNLHLS